MEWVALVLLAIGGLGFWAQHVEKKAKHDRAAREQQARRDYLASKYAGSPFRDDIVNGTIRPGMNVEQLVDSWGKPAAVDERVLKTKVVHTYKYAQKSARSFRQKVKVEDGIVVGWTNTD